MLMLMMLMLVMMFLTPFFCLTIKKDFVIHIVGIHTSIGTGAVVSSSIATGTRTTFLS
jgi:hypothetical protein